MPPLCQFCHPEFHVLGLVCGGNSICRNTAYSYSAPLLLTIPEGSEIAASPQRRLVGFLLRWRLGSPRRWRGQIEDSVRSPTDLLDAGEVSLAADAGQKYTAGESDNRQPGQLPYIDRKAADYCDVNISTSQIGMEHTRQNSASYRIANNEPRMRRIGRATNV
jgi:hypothetical protein